MPGNVTQFPLPLRPAPQPLGLYLRPGHGDHCQLGNVLLEGSHRIFGAVIEATLSDRHRELRDQLAKNRLDVILDPRTQPAALPGGFKPALGALPWGGAGQHVLDDFRGFAGRQRMVQLAEFTVANGYTQVMAPTHVIVSPNDPWLWIDLEATTWLRAELDRRGGARIPIVYSLAVAYAVIKDPEQRAALIASLASTPAGSLWLKVDGFGADTNPTAMSNYLDAATAFHALGLPVVADHVGGLPALTLLAFGAVGGIAHGITSNEGFKSYAWRNPKDRGGGTGGWRVYFPALDLMLTKGEAERLLGSSPRAKALFGNRNTQACPRGVDDMIANPVRAFVVQRAEEVGSIGVVPEELRPQTFLDGHVRPTTDRALAAAKIDWGADEAGRKLGKKLGAHRKRLDDFRIALGARADRMPPRSFALQPPTRIAREAGR